MKNLRKAMSIVVSLVMVLTMVFMSGCSTPQYAMTVDGRSYTTGEYLANLWSNFAGMYYGQGMYQYAMYGMDVWTETIPYGEGDAAIELPLDGYIKETTKDGIKRQAAVKKLMEQYGITVAEEDLEKGKEDAKSMLAYYGLVSDKGTIKESKMIELGFNLESFNNMYLAMNVEEPELFYTLYGKGGQKEVAEAEVLKFYEDSYVAYKEITISQMDEEGNVLADADIEANRTLLQGYLDMITAGTDMDDVIAKYNEDTNPTTTTAATTTTTAAADDTTTTTAAEETTTTTTTTTTTSSETSTTATTTTTNPNLKVLTTVSGDEKTVEAIKTVPVGSAQIVKYTDESDTTYLSLIYRVDMAEAGESYNFENQRETCLYGMKFEEYDAELMALVETLEVSIDTTAIDMCDPKNFEAKMNEILGLA